MAKERAGFLVKYRLEYLSMITFLGSMVSLVLANAIRLWCTSVLNTPYLSFYCDASVAGCLLAHLFDYVISFDNGLIGLLPYLARRTGASCSSVPRLVLIYASFRV